MNLLDALGFAILALSTAAGYYQGFLATAANCAGYITALLSASWFYGSVAERIKEAGKIIPALIYYSESGDLLGSVETFRLNVTTLNQSAMDGILSRVELPHPVGQWLAENVLGLRYSADGLTQLGDYLSRTIAEAAVSIGCYLLMFLAIYIGLTLMINIANYTIKFPALKAFDGLAGAGLGLVRGGLLVFAAFMVLPVLLSMLPVAQVKDIVEGSALTGFFYEKNFMFGLIRSYIP